MTPRSLAASGRFRSYGRFRWATLPLICLFALSITESLVVREASAQTPPCTQADRIKDAKLFDRALALYSELLAENAELACAKAGVTDIAETRGAAGALLAEGLAREAGGDDDGVEQLYVGALALDPELKGAQQALDQSLKAETDEVLAPVTALAKAGFHDEASAKLREILTEKPETTIPADLQYLKGGHRSFVQVWRQDLPGWLYWPQYLLQVAVAALVALPVGYLMVRSRTRVPRLEVKDFNKGPIALDIGQNVSARLEQCLLEFNADRVRPSINLLSGPIEGIKIPAELGVPPQARWLSVLIDWLLPQKVLTLDGYLQNIPDRGAGLMLQLTKRKEQVASVTLWQRDFAGAAEPVARDDQEIFDELAEVGAVWVLFKLLDEAREDLAPLGTAEWRSYANYRVGLRHGRRGDIDGAILLYRRALAITPVNQGALTNLGIQQARKKDYGAAVVSLGKAQQAIETAAKSNQAKHRFVGTWYVESFLRTLTAKPNMSEHRFVGAWYTATYWRAITLDYMGAKFWPAAQTEAGVLVENLNHTMIELLLRLGGSDRKQRQRARNIQKQEAPIAEEESSMLIGELEENLASRSKTWTKNPRRQREKRLLNFLRSFRLTAIIMCATVAVENKQPSHGRRLVHQISESDRELPSVCYELACYYTACGVAARGRRRELAFKHALGQLELALLGDPSQLKSAETDRSLDALRNEASASYHDLINNLSSARSNAGGGVKVQQGVVVPSAR